MKSLLIKRLEARERRMHDVDYWKILDEQKTGRILDKHGNEIDTAKKLRLAQQDIINLDKKIGGHNG